MSSRTGTGWLLLACLHGHASAAGPPSLADEIAQRARVALSVARADDFQMSVERVAARDGAQHDCPGGWQIGQEPSFSHFRRIAVPVRCGERTGQVIVRLQVRAAVWVLQQAQPAGHRVAADDLRREQREVHSLAELAGPAKPIGLPLRRSLRAGDPLRPTDVEQPLLVKRGDTVELVAAADGVAVSVAAVALGPGRVGDVVSVRNVRTQRVVKGKVAGAGTVEALGG